VYEGTFDEIDDHFKGQLWSDELPIIPPTLERVQAFLKHNEGAHRTTHCRAGAGQSDGGAVEYCRNGVMAGCRPEHMPVLIAAVEAIADNSYNLNNIGSTWGVLPFLGRQWAGRQELGIENGATARQQRRESAIGRRWGSLSKYRRLQVEPQPNGYVRYP